MVAEMAYKKYHLVLKAMAAMMIMALSLSTFMQWDFQRIGFTSLYILLWNGILNEKIFPVWKKMPFAIIKLIGNLVSISLILYFMGGKDNFSYVVYYAYLALMISFYYKEKISIGMGLLSLALSFILFWGQPFDWLHGLRYIFIYEGAALIGYLARLEQDRSKKLTSRIKELDTLYRISRIIDEFPDTQEILNQITQLVAKSMGFASSVIMFYDEAIDRLLVKSSYGLKTEILERIVLSQERGIEKELIHGIRQIAIYHRNEDEFTFGGENVYGKKISYAVAVPLLLKNKVIGTLSIYDEESKSLTEENRELLYMMSSRIGMVLENDQLYKQLMRNAATDGLTGLYNHKQFYERLKQQIKTAKMNNTSLFLLMVDIDRFKCFNDQFGHLIGDKVLVEVARVIKNSIKDSDVAARYGGEEFAIILSNSTIEDAEKVADRIRNHVKDIPKEIKELQAQNVEITVSIGISCYPNCSNDMSNLVDIADIRMYKGKEMGGDHVVA